MVHYTNYFSQPKTTMLKVISIFARVSGNIQQDIQLNEGIEISDKELVDGLQSGKYVTTISHAANANDCGALIQTDPFQIIGKVIYQEALEDLEIDDFENCDIETLRF